jgi:integrase
MIAGDWIDTPARVYDIYTPRHEYVSERVWELVRPLAIAACRAADHSSVDAALAAIRAAAQFLAWCHQQEIPLQAECVFLADHVERFVATQAPHMTPASRATRRSHLRRVARAATKTAPWPQPDRVYVRDTPMTTPLMPAEVEAYWDALRAQPTASAERRLKAFMVLCLGAGLRAGEALTVTVKDHVGYTDADGVQVCTIHLPDRLVPVDTRYMPLLHELAEYDHAEPLVGPYNPQAKHPVGNLIEVIALPAKQRTLRLSRLRITWMVNILSRDIRISEFQALAGVVSAKTLETVAPFVPGRFTNGLWLRKAAGA